jgi:hypothetical protein
MTRRLIRVPLIGTLTAHAPALLSELCSLDASLLPLHREQRCVRAAKSSASAAASTGDLLDEIRDLLQEQNARRRGR